MQNSITMPVNKIPQQDCFNYREFRHAGYKCIEQMTTVSLYRRIMVLRLTNLTTANLGLPTEQFFPVCLFPEEWPPALIDDFLNRQSCVQLELWQ